MKALYHFLNVLLFFFLVGCTSSNKNRLEEHHGNRYAQGFSITSAQGNDSSAFLFRSQLRCRFGDTLLLSDTLLVLKQPPKRIVCLSTTQIPYLKALGKLSTIVGIGGTRYVSEPSLQDAIHLGTIAEVGTLPNLNYEQILALAPDLVLGYDAALTQVTNYANRLRSFKIPVLSIDDYQESHPLGRAEWLKFFAFLFQSNNIADSLLDSVFNSYEAISFSQTKTHVPTILINYPWKGVWYIPTQESYMAQLIRDAGGKLLLSSEGKEGATATPTSTDLVLQTGVNAEYWLNPGECERLDDLEVYSAYRAVRNRKVYNNTKRRNQNGGNDFYESGILLPHLILRDLYTILHPSPQDSSRVLYFYKKLE